MTPSFLLSRIALVASLLLHVALATAGTGSLRASASTARVRVGGSSSGASLLRRTSAGRVAPASAGLRARRNVAGRRTASIARSSQPTRRVAGRRVDPVTSAVLKTYGLNPSSRLYRVTQPEYVDLAHGTVRGNPKSVAMVADGYHPQQNPTHVAMARAGLDPDELGIPAQQPRPTEAGSLGPGLNVAVENPSVYAEHGAVLISVGVKDLLSRGARFYPDTSGGQILRPLFVTFQGAVPFRREGGGTVSGKSPLRPSRVGHPSPR